MSNDRRLEEIPNKVRKDLSVLRAEHAAWKDAMRDARQEFEDAKGFLAKLHKLTNFVRETVRSAPKAYTYLSIAYVLIDQLLHLGVLAWIWRIVQ